MPRQDAVGNQMKGAEEHPGDRYARNRPAALEHALQGAPQVWMLPPEEEEGREQDRPDLGQHQTLPSAE